MNINKNPLEGVPVDFFNLGDSGSKVLALIDWSLSHDNSDLIVLDSKTLNRWNAIFYSKKISRASLKSGVIRLKNANIISRPVTKNVYFVNPRFVEGDSNE